ncbi:MAG: hypothetical protein EOO15_21895, partial [Chitinophagaceae bacterium]
MTTAHIFPSRRPGRTLLVIVLFCLSQVAAEAQNALDRVGLTATTPASPAYSLRKLSSAYTGSAVQVRRSSDNTTMNIGFTAGGDLDTVALKSFVGSGSGFVTRWYDQGGGAIDVTDVSVPLQPRLVNAGVVERLNGRPAIWFGTAKLATTSRVIFSNAASMVAVARGTSTTPSTLVSKTGLANGTLLHYPAPFDYTNTGGDFLVGNPTIPSAASIGTHVTNPVSSVADTTGAAVFSFVIPGTSGTFFQYKNGVQTASQSVVSYFDGGSPLMIGNRNDGGGSGNFWTPEIVLFNSALSTTDRNTLEAAQKAYYLSNNADLAALSLSTGSLAPSFAASTTSYSGGAAILPAVTALPSGVGASVKMRLNGGSYQPVVNGAASTPFALAVGNNTIDIQVTAQDRTQKTYSISLTYYNNFDVLGLSASLAAVPAYSLRRLGTAYAGKALTVRRGNDNATLDIGFTASGDLDTAALKTFAGSNSAYVTRWYDQSGNALDAEQGTPVLQPRIVNAGVVERLNGRPAIWFGTANLFTAKQVLYPDAASMVGFAKGNSTTPSSFVSKSGTAADLSLNYPSPFDYTNNSGEFTVGSAAAAQHTVINTAVTSPNSGVRSSVPASVYSFVIPGTSGTFANYINGVQASSQPFSVYNDGGNSL